MILKRESSLEQHIISVFRKKKNTSVVYENLRIVSMKSNATYFIEKKIIQTIFWTIMQWTKCTSEITPSN